MQERVLKAGNFKVVYENIPFEIANKIFNYELPSQHFKKEAHIVISSTKELELWRKYKEAKESMHAGGDLPKSWEIRKIDGGFIFSVPKYSSFIFVEKNNEKTIIKIGKKLVSERTLELGTMDIMQFYTSFLSHSIAFHYNGSNFLLVGNSESGKTTLFLQLLKSLKDLKLISEERTLINNATAFMISPKAYVRKESSFYLFDKPIEGYIDLREYISILPFGEIDFIIQPKFSTNDVYYIKEIEAKKLFKPFIRDWFANILNKKEVFEIKERNMLEVDKLPKIAFEFNFSKDPERTAKLFKELSRC
jgi:hypothetical protein